MTGKKALPCMSEATGNFYSVTRWRSDGERVVALQKKQITEEEYHKLLEEWGDEP